MTTNKKKELFLEALKQSAGNITAACFAVKISRQCYYDWKKGLNDPEKTPEENQQEADEFCSLVLNIEETNLDLGETKLLQRVNGSTFEETTTERKFNKKTKKYEMVVTKVVTKHIPPSDSAIAFLLSRKGKGRGYGEKGVTVNVLNVSQRNNFTLKVQADENNGGNDQET